MVSLCLWYTSGNCISLVLGKDYAINNGNERRNQLISRYKIEEDPTRWEENGDIVCILKFQPIGFSFDISIP